MPYDQRRPQWLVTGFSYALGVGLLVKLVIWAWEWIAERL